MEPFYQKLVKWIGWIFAGLLCLGSFLDAVSNAITIITPSITYIGTLLILLCWLLAFVFLKYKPIRWVARNGQLIRITKLNSKFYFLLAGFILLLWIPYFINSSNNPSLEITNLTDYSTSPEYDDVVTKNNRLTFIKWTGYYKVINDAPEDILLSDFTINFNENPTIKLFSENHPSVIVYHEISSLVTEINTPKPLRSPSNYPIHIPPHTDAILVITFLLSAYQNGQMISFYPEEIDKANLLIATYFGIEDTDEYSRKINYRLLVNIKNKQGNKIIPYDLFDHILFIGKKAPGGGVKLSKKITTLQPIGQRMESYVQTVTYEGFGSSSELLAKYSDEELQKYIVSNINDFNGYLSLFNRHLVKGAYEQAEAILVKYIPKDLVEKAVVKNNLAVLEFDKRNFKKGLAYLDESIQMDPCGGYLPFHNIKEYYLFIKDYKSAMLTIKRYLDTCNENIDYWIHELYLLLPYSENLNEDLKYFIKASKLKPSDGDIYYYIGSIYKMMGENMNAVEYFNKAIELGTVYEINESTR